MSDEPIEAANPAAWADELRESRKAALAAAAPDVAICLLRHGANISALRLEVRYDDGMELAAELEIGGILTRSEIERRFPPDVAAKLLRAGDRVDLEGGYSLEMFHPSGGPKTRGKRRRKNPAFKPVENPPKKAGPQ